MCSLIGTSVKYPAVICLVTSDAQVLLADDEQQKEISIHVLTQII